MKNRAVQPGSIKSFILRKELVDDVNDLCTDTLLSLNCGSTDMRSAAYHGMVVKSLVLGGFLGPNIQTGGANLTGLKSGKQRILVDVGTTAGVDDVDAVLHLGDRLLVDEGLAVEGGSMEGDEIGVSENLVHLGILHVLILDAFNMIDVISKNLHAESLCLATETLTDAAVTDNTECLTGKLDALSISFLLPLVLTHGMTGGTYKASAGEHMSERELGNSVGGSARSIANGNALFLGILMVDIVDAYAAADDELELAAFNSGVDSGNVDLGRGTNNENVEILNLLSQLLRGVELLNNLVTLCLKLCNGTLLHTIGCKNTHVYISPLITVLLLSHMLGFVFLEELNKGDNAFFGHGVVNGGTQTAYALMALQIVKARCLCGDDDIGILLLGGGYERNVHERTEFGLDCSLEELGLIEEIIQYFSLMLIHLIHDLKTADALQILKDLTADIDAPAVGSIIH